jgi:hypothetical protein
LFTEEELADSYQKNANFLQSAVLMNDGSGKFKIMALPLEAQFAPIYGILSQDFNLDGNLDLLLVGNDHSIEYMSGRIDAFNGLCLIGNGDGSFNALKPYESGFSVPGDAKSIVSIFGKDDQQLILSTQNKESLVVHQFMPNSPKIAITTNDAIWAKIKYKNGKTRKHEFYHGTSFISQSSRKLPIVSYVDEIILIDSEGESTAMDIK